METRSLNILLSAPRGFCAGVDRAIRIVELALEKFGPPVYVRHEIVHNKYVVDSLKAKGAVFVEELDQVPDDGQPVIFSAHGVPKSVPEEANKREMFFLDATCPLVSKVHREAERHYKNGDQIILIGHAGHPEVIGTIGQLPDGAVLLVETVEDVQNLRIQEASSRLSGAHGGISTTDGGRSFDFAQDDGVVWDESKLAYCTQTTLSVDDTAGIVEALQARFPEIKGPHKEDICYATTNRQEAVKAIAERADALLVLGAPNSSNSNRLVEVGLNYGCEKARLIQRASEIDWDWMDGVATLGITAGASAPEVLVEEVIATMRGRYEVFVEEVSIAKEDVIFKLPKALSAA